MPSGSTPEQPFRINLEQQRDRARELLRAAKTGDPSAVARFRAWHDPDHGPTLTAAQHVIARELRLPCWPGLMAHVAAMDAARSALRAEALDQEPTTLHIRCGSDIAPALREAGFVGEFLEYSDPICQGPVVDAPDYLCRRARFVTGEYGKPLGLTTDAVEGKLADAEARLQTAPDWPRVVLWFEHDSYDQLLLARCLARFSLARPHRLELICVDTFPGSDRFIGLGQLPPEALRLLWSGRRPVTLAQLALGTAIWDALRSPDPTRLTEIAATGTPVLPQSAPALRRHLRELPDVRSGLGMTQRLVLELVAEGVPTLGRVFKMLTQGRDPLPWLGDIMLLAIVEAMARAHEPALAIGAGEPWPRRALRLSEAGRAVLSGRRDYLDLGPEARWVGGTEIRADALHWRWDTGARRPVRSG